MPHTNFSISMSPGMGSDENVTKEFYEQGGGNAVRTLLNWVDAHGCVGSNKSLLSFENVVRGFLIPLKRDNMEWMEHFAYVWTAAGPSPPVTRMGWLEMACTYPPQFDNDDTSRLMSFNQVELVRSISMSFLFFSFHVTMTKNDMFVLLLRVQFHCHGVRVVSSPSYQLN